MRGAWSRLKSEETHLERESRLIKANQRNKSRLEKKNALAAKSVSCQEHMNTRGAVKSYYPHAAPLFTRRDKFDPWFIVTTLSIWAV